MLLLSLAPTLGSLHTNFLFFLIFNFASVGSGTAAAGFWLITEGDAEYGGKLLVATGATFFAADILGRYLFFPPLIGTMELPIPDLPIFDPIQVIRPKSTDTEP